MVVSTTGLSLNAAPTSSSNGLRAMPHKLRQPPRITHAIGGKQERAGGADSTVFAVTRRLRHQIHQRQQPPYMAEKQPNGARTFVVYARVGAVPSGDFRPPQGSH